MRIKDIVLIGMMSALIITVQVGLSFLPNIELVSLFIILFTLFFREKAVYIIYVFVITEGLIYGFGLWWINYMYVWTILFIVTLIFKERKSLFFWSFVSGIFGYSFGALCSIPYFITGGIPSGFAYWVSGIPFDLTHGTFNFLVTLVLFRPLYLLLNIIMKKVE
jgi:energy-coupling factor transport system substrate-specific component